MIPSNEKHLVAVLDELPTDNGFEWADERAFPDGRIGKVYRAVQPSGGYTGLPGKIEVSADDAARIAASWNACHTIPTESLTPGCVAELVAACEAIDQFQRTYQERTDNPCPGNELYADWLMAIVKQARAALARVRKPD